MLNQKGNGMTEDRKSLLKQLVDMRILRRSISDKPGFNAWGDSADGIMVRDLDVLIEKLAAELHVKPWLTISYI